MSEIAPFKTICHTLSSLELGVEEGEGSLLLDPADLVVGLYTVQENI